ncbi:hypothetical protein HYI36_24715 [Bacillus sp. Gen3]|nr:hypothetical protein [Bacillus sp. Gen3]
MDQKSKEKILKYWGVQAGEISKLSEQAILVKDITNEKYVLKRKLDIQVTRNELAILQYLQDFDISVSTPMLSKRIHISLMMRGGILAYIPICQDEYFLQGKSLKIH